MALSLESQSYLISGMGSTFAGNELIDAIETSAMLSADSFTRLETCFGEDGVATNFQNAILGTYALSPRDTQFVTDGFSLPLSALASVLDNVMVVAPVFSPPAGSYGPTESVTLSSLTPNATFYYTTNGSTPTTGSTLYTGPITVSSTETIKAIAVTSGTHNSAVSSAAYVIDGAVATPTFSPVAGAYGPTQSVTISSATSGATLYYTTNGSTPTTASTLYTVPVSVAVSETVKAIGVKTAFVNSAVGSAVYTINGAVDTPSFSPVAGPYTGTQMVTISTVLSGTSIFYTEDGSDPTTGSTPYTGPVSVAVSETVKAIATKAGYSNSAIGSAAYVIS